MSGSVQRHSRIQFACRVVCCDWNAKKDGMEPTFLETKNKSSSKNKHIRILGHTGTEKTNNHTNCSVQQIHTNLSNQRLATNDFLRLPTQHPPTLCIHREQLLHSGLGQSNNSVRSALFHPNHKQYPRKHRMMTQKYVVSIKQPGKCKRQCHPGWIRAKGGERNRGKRKKERRRSGKEIHVPWDWDP